MRQGWGAPAGAGDSNLSEGSGFLAYRLPPRQLLKKKKPGVVVHAFNPSA